MSKTTNKIAITSKKIQANRQNARCSTGPRTPAGKRKVSFNALRHGLLCRELFLPGARGQRQQQQELARLLAGLHRDLRPRGALERALVEKIAVCFLRLGRVLRCESGEIHKALEADAL